VLENRTGLGRFRRPHRAQILRSVALIKNNQPVEILSAPLQQLLQPRLVLPPGGVALADQRRVRAEDDSLLDVAVDGRRYFRVFELVQGMHLDPAGADVLQVPLGVVLEIVRDRYPDGALASFQVVLEDDAGDRATFADAGAVTYQKTRPGTVGEDVLVRLRRVSDALELQRRQRPRTDRLVGHRQFVPDVGGRHRRQRRRLHHRVRVFLTQLQLRGHVVRVGLRHSQLFVVHLNKPGIISKLIILFSQK
jgi:hypothetical protein